MYKVNNKDTRTTPMAYFTPCSSVSIVNFEHVIAGWVYCLKTPENRKLIFSVGYRNVTQGINGLNRITYLAY